MMGVNLIDSFISSRSTRRQTVDVLCVLSGTRAWVVVPCPGFESMQLDCFVVANQKSSCRLTFANRGGMICSGRSHDVPNVLFCARIELTFSALYRSRLTVSRIRARW